MLRFGLLLCLLLPASAAVAQTSRYAIEPENSSVGFETDFGPDKITGRMPVTQADLSLDFGNVTRSTVAVTLDVSRAQASFPFAAQALKGPKVLDARTFPSITFASTSVQGGGETARIEGDLTIRGVTRPVALDATLYRQQGFALGDNSHLTIRLTGRVLRSDYGATGWADLVGDEVRLDILARIAEVE